MAAVGLGEVGAVFAKTAPPDFPAPRGFSYPKGVSRVLSYSLATRVVYVDG